MKFYWNLALSMIAGMLAAWLCSGCRTEARDACVPLRLEVSAEAENWPGAVEGIEQARQAWQDVLPDGFSEDADVVRVEVLDTVVSEGEVVLGVYRPESWSINLTGSEHWNSSHYRIQLLHELGHALSAVHHPYAGVMTPPWYSYDITQADLDTLDECWK